MAFMKDILTRNIPIWEECAATPFVQEVQTGKLPLEKFKRYMIQDSIYLKNYARIYGKAIFHADTIRRNGASGHSLFQSQESVRLPL